MENSFLKSKWTPFAVAFAIGLVAVGYYVFSGRGSLDLQTRELTNSSNIAEVNLSNRQRINIKCRNGEAYEIVFTEDQPNYDQLIFDSCGIEGGEVEAAQ
ncbi:MAG TPA: hypothetical protein VI588_02080 [Candidatus Gracilibacteria bacterium]|nr:hypothetical protein [Candidatus Gracilibacteria bacterium]